MSDYKNNSLLQSSSPNNIYTQKKTSVVVRSFHNYPDILFKSIILCCRSRSIRLRSKSIITKVYFVHMSDQEELKEDLTQFNMVSEAWNNSYHDDFADWRIKIKNPWSENKINLVKDTHKMHNYEDQDEIFYRPLQFITTNISIFDGIHFKKVYAESTVSINSLTTVQHIQPDHQLDFNRG